MHALGPSFQYPQVSSFWFQKDFDPLRDDPRFQNLRNEQLGCLEAGKLADLVVLDKHPLDRNVPDEDLSEISVVATIIGGEVAYAL